MLAILNNSMNQTHPLKEHVESCVKMSGLPNRIVSNIFLLSVISYFERDSVNCFSV